METFKEIINAVSRPQIFFTVLVLTFFFLFPPTGWFFRWNRRLRLQKLWTNAGAFVFFSLLTIFLVIALQDHNCRLILLKPDNVPITAMIYVVPFFLWLSMKQAEENDRRLEKGEPPAEYHDPADKVLVWPDLVYVEFISLILCMVVLIGWSIGLKAPLEEPANPSISPNPSKAPWYFLGLQEMLVYYDPWLAGVVFPTLIIVGLMAIPYIDTDPKGQGYFSYRGRMLWISLFLFGFLILWVSLIMTGTFLRGPNWNFFGPFEKWDINKLEPLTNINLSEYVFVIGLGRGLPNNIWLRELPGFMIIAAYFLILPPLLARTWLKRFYQAVGPFKYSVFIVLSLSGLSLLIKMYLRWIFNLKYIVAIPEFFFNI
jgi:hypothetical protein